MKHDNQPGIAAWVLRIALLIAAVSLAAYIPYKYATHLHAINGVYAFLFPLSSILALAGIALALRPRLAHECNVPLRAGIGALAVLWMATGLLCVKTLTFAVAQHPVGGGIALFHMLAQHVFLSLTLLTAAFLPERVAAGMGQQVVSRGAPAPHGAAEGL